MHAQNHMIKFTYILRLIRLTSPNLNYLIVVGAIILYIDISVSVAPTTDLKVVAILCNVSSNIVHMYGEYRCTYKCSYLCIQLAPWLNAIGYSLCFGTIVVKMFRVYYIFNSPTPTKKIVYIYAFVHVHV